MMKGPALIVSICLFLAGPGLKAQTGVITQDHDIIDFMNTDHDFLSNQREFYERVDGSPYLDDTFREGSLCILDRRFSGLRLRYNAYEGHFEFETENGIRFLDPNKTPADTVWMEEETYVYAVYSMGKKLGKTYMKRMNRGATALYLHREIRLLEAEEAQGYQDARPARFDQRPEAWYIQVPGKAALQVRGKKDLKVIFPDSHDEVAAYMKSEKLKLKEADDLAALCSFADSLH